MKLVDTDIAIDHFHGHRAARDFFASVLDSGDALIAATASLTDAVLVTRNVKHYL